jgi:DNA-binding transcriptional LysR family regulator
MSSNVGWRTLGTDLLSLRIFVAVAEEGSLALAASRENIAASAASRRISYLEARTGLALFDRRDRGLTLTRAGEEILDKVRDVFRLLERVALDVEGLRAGVRGHVRIQAHMSATLLGLPNLIGAFLTAHEGIDIDFEERTSFEILHAIRTGMIDVGLVGSGIESEGVELIPWSADELMAVVPAGHELASHPELTIQAMLKFPFVMMQRESALLALAQARAQELGGRLHIRAHAASFESARELVAAGLGVAILPAPAIKFHEDTTLIARPLAEDWASRRLLICVRERSRLTAAARLFVEYLTTAI